MALDLHKLRHLVAIADEGSFTKAAARLHISQQALSSSIQKLEREVGVPLLDRSGVALVVLPAGQSLIDDARILHGLANTALHRARRIGRGETEVLRIGHTPAVTSEEVTALIERARPALGQASTHVNQRYPDELAAGLLAGSLDIGLCRAMTPAPGLNRTVLGHHRLHIAVAAGHRLADQGTIQLGELAGETLIVWGPPQISGYTDLLLEHCRRGGLEPRIQINPVQGTPPVTAVLDTAYFAFVTAPTGFALEGRVRVLELNPPIHTPLHALWCAHGRSELRDVFIQHFTGTEPTLSSPLASGAEALPAPQR